MHKLKKQNTWFIVSTIASPAELLRLSLVILSYINTSNGKGDFSDAKLKKGYPFQSFWIKNTLTTARRLRSFCIMIFNALI
jgi:hypothetical protein